MTEKTNNKLAYETASFSNAFEGLNSDKDKGLTSEEAKSRLEKYGENKLKEKEKKSWLRIFFEQMNNPMIYILFAAVAVTIGVSIYNMTIGGEGEWPDVIIILGVVILNSVIGTIQEVKAQTSLDALKKLSSPYSTVLRDGKRSKVKSSELVLGDIVIIEEGDTIGADLRLIESVNLKCDESSLTGESLPVGKDANVVFTDNVSIADRVNMVYMSTPVSYGRGAGIVVATGMDTEIGKIATALDNEEDDQTPLQKVLAKLSKALGFLTIGIVAAVLLIEIIWMLVRGQASDVTNWIEAILEAIALAVAAIPEGLVAVVTIVLSLGLQRLVKVRSIVKKLPAVETLGSVSVVCSDKTGTLTQNKMTVLEAYTNDVYFKVDNFNVENKIDNLSLLAKGMSLCSNATVDEGIYGDPTEIALVEFANKFGMHKKDIQNELPRVDELPFDSVRKMMSTKHTYKDGFIVFTKGALDSIIPNSKYILDNGNERELTKQDIENIYKANKYFSDKALRVLTLAYRKNNEIKEEEMVFVGLVAMIDPPRKEAKDAVAKFKSAGITTIMITGDHKDTAFAIAKELGIASDISECIMGQELSKYNDEEMKELVKRVRVFARVSPENKVQIVKAIKANGNIAAMTGDGVNDAPSLKAADIGIAMGITGTDVAKGAADMVLADDNFATIEEAVEEGRNIYANIKKTVIFLLSSNIAEVLIMLLIIAFGFKSPFLAIHLLWINLITDSLPAVALGMDTKDKNIMNNKPRDPNDTLFSHGGLRDTLMFGVFLTLAVIFSYLSAFWINGITTYEGIINASSEVVSQAQTMSFVSLAFAELIHMVCVSNTSKSFVYVFKNKNWMMLLAFVLGIGLQLFVVLTPGVNTFFSVSPLSGKEWLITGLLALVPLLAHEVMVLVKFIYKKIR